MPTLKSSGPEWSVQIRGLIGKLTLSQMRLAELVGVSPSTVTRWVSGSHEPSPASYMALANLVGPPDAIYFWERAGIDPVSFPEPNLRASLSSLRVHLKDLKIARARKISKEVVASDNTAVLVPLLNVIAHGDQCPPGPHVTLAQARTLDVLMAPLNWCPHPESMLCMQISGDSMAPVIPPSAILCIDTAVTDRGQLDKNIVVFSHRDRGFKVARLRRLPSADILVSANQSCMPVDVTNPSKWKPVGEVVWWISKDTLRPGSKYSPLLQPKSLSVL
jgi:transcriptional regulator with XRE-family HTH domain